MAAIDAAEALAKGLSNPAKLIEAAKLFAVSAAYGALASKLGGGGGGGGVSGSGAGGFGGATDNAAGDGAGGGTIVIQGGIVNMDDPEQAQAFEDAVNRLAGAGRIEVTRG